MANIIRLIQRGRELKGKSQEEKDRLKRYFRREDAAIRAVKIQREDAERARNLAELKRQADEEEARERIERAQSSQRALKRTDRPFSPYTYTDKNVKMRQRAPRITKRIPRLR